MRKRLMFSVFALFAATADACGGEMDPQTPLIPPASQTVPRSTGAPSMEARISAALDLKAGALTVSSAISEYRIGQELKDALKDALVRADNVLDQTGAPGLLLRGVYERAKDAELYSDDMPVNTTQKLIGNQMEIVGVGSAPQEALALDYYRTAGKGAFRSGPAVGNVPINVTKEYWVTRSGSGIVAVEQDGNNLKSEARQLLSDKALFQVMHQNSYSKGLGDGIAALERSGQTEELRKQAAALRANRDITSKKLQEIDATLKEELDRARKANRDAEVFAITQALLGAGSSVAASQHSSVPEKAKILVKERVEIHNQLIINDSNAKQLLDQNGRGAYLPPPP
jgi:hypothetical protein